MLYRIAVEYDEYLGAGEYKTKKYYQYAFGLYGMWKECLRIKFNDNERIIQMVKIKFSLRNLLLCLRKSESSSIPIDF